MPAACHFGCHLWRGSGKALQGGIQWELGSFVSSHCRAEHVRILIPAAFLVVPPLPGGGSQPALCVKAKPVALQVWGIWLSLSPPGGLSVCLSAVLLCQAVQCNQFRGKINRDNDSGSIINAIPAQVCWLPVTPLMWEENSAWDSVLDVFIFVVYDSVWEFSIFLKINKQKCIIKQNTLP